MDFFSSDGLISALMDYCISSSGELISSLMEFFSSGELISPLKDIFLLRWTDLFSQSD
jgi:hypothetical protein